MDQNQHVKVHRSGKAGNGRQVKTLRQMPVRLSGAVVTKSKTTTKLPPLKPATSRKRSKD